MAGTVLCVADSSIGASERLEAKLRDANLRALVFLTVTTRRLDGLTQVVTGSGFIYRSEGEVLSCGSLLPEELADYSKIAITGSVGGRNKETYPLTMLRNDGPNDILILQLPARSEPWSSIHSEGKPRKNIPFIALGFSPNGEAVATPGKITGEGKEADYHLNLTDATFKPGMTGGPALDLSGALVGIVGGPPERTPSLTRLVWPPGAWALDVISPSPSPTPYPVPVLYATNRAVHVGTETEGVQKYEFTATRSPGLTFGSAVVSIPHLHRRGHIERPHLDLLLLTFLIVRYEPETPTSHFVVTDPRILTKDDFAQQIRDAGTASALLYVHGFNTTFEEALFTLAQIKFDTGFSGVAVAFSWPSQGNPFSYNYDNASVDFSRGAFVQVIDLLKTNARVSKIYVIAHSLGNRLVADALANERDSQTHVNELIMAAPDVDLDVFSTLSQRMHQVTDGITLYASAGDKALQLSELLAQGPRAGSVAVASEATGFPGVEIIDVTGVGLDFFRFNHSLFSSTRTLLNDISRILLDGKHPPDSRSPAEFLGMPEGSKTPLYWKIRE
jgi:esterase/lipase superfamily enzyme